MPTTIAWLATFLASTAAPAAAEPPKKTDPATLTIIGFGETAVTVPAKARAKYEAVKTADGPRVRVTIGEVVFESPRVVFRVVRSENVEVVTIEPSADGKTFAETLKQIPAKKP